MTSARACQRPRLTVKIGRYIRNIVPLRRLNALQMNTTASKILSTVSEYMGSNMTLRTNNLDYGLVIKAGEFVFVKNDSTEDWIARVERVCGEKRKLYVRWMREDGQEIVMGDEFAWLSVDTIQDLVQPRPQVHSPIIEEYWMYKTAPNRPSLSPLRGEHAPLQTGSAENSKSNTTESIFRQTPFSDCDIEWTTWYPIDNLEGDAHPVPGMTTKTRLPPLQLRESRQWNLPPLWEVLGCYRHHPPVILFATGYQSTK